MSEIVLFEPKMVKSLFGVGLSVAIASGESELITSSMNGAPFTVSARGMQVRSNPQVIMAVMMAFGWCFIIVFA
jgi:hypothetical protein